jgi:hypothetical protein
MWIRRSVITVRDGTGEWEVETWNRKIWNWRNLKRENVKRGNLEQRFSAT